MNITVTIFNIPQKEIENVKIEKTLFWYDSEHQEMFTFKGGALDLINKVFDEKLQRLVPKIVDVTVPVAKAPILTDKVMNWFKNYSNYNNTQAEITEQNSNSTVISVPEKEFRDLVYDLERNNIRFQAE